MHNRVLLHTQSTRCKVNSLTHLASATNDIYLAFYGVRLISISIGFCQCMALPAVSSAQANCITRAAREIAQQNKLLHLNVNRI